MRFISLDFETYYAKDYSLSLRGMTMEQYIRDPRFQTLMMSFAVDDGEIYNVVGREETAKALQWLNLSDPNTCLVAHNAAFECAVIEWRYGIKVANAICTADLARSIGLDRFSRVGLGALAEFFAKRQMLQTLKGTEIENMQGKRLEDFTPQGLKNAIEYCNDDVHITRSIFLMMIPYAYNGSFEAIDMTVKMYSRPMIELNVPLLQEYLQRVLDAKAEVMAEFSRRSGVSVADIDSVIRSPTKFPLFFKQVTGMDLPTKLSLRRTATFKKKLAELIAAHGDGSPQVVQLIEKTNGAVQNKAGEWEVWAPATAKDDLEFLDLLEHRDPLVVAAVEAKMANSSNLAESRAQRFIDTGIRGLLPVPLIFASAHTGRYGGGGGYNLQNLPSRGDRSLRDSMQAPEGHSMIAADSSQIEARILAWAAGQTNVVDLFAEGGDVYSHMGSAIYNVPYETIVEWRGKPLDDLTEEEIALVKRCKIIRDVGKEAVLASGYQMSGAAFASRLLAQKTMLKPLDGREMTEQEAEQYHEDEARRINGIYRGTNANIVGFWRQCQNVLDQMVVGGSGWFGGATGELFYFGSRFFFGEYVPAIMLPNGFWINFPHLSKQYNEETGFEEFTYRAVDAGHWRTFYLYGGKLTENLIQALAFAVLVEQAVMMRDRGVPIMINIHDEWGACVRDEYVPEVAKIMEECMNHVPEYLQGCPLTCEVNIGKNYGQV